MSLPEGHHPFQIKESVFNQISLDDLRKENVLDVLIQFLDGHLGKDVFTDSKEKFDDFENFQRADRQSIREYIASFDSKYGKLEN